VTCPGLWEWVYNAPKPAGSLRIHQESGPPVSPLCYLTGTPHWSIRPYHSAKSPNPIL